jgi:flagellar biosynthetic protein FliR
MELLVAEVVKLFYTLLWPMIRISAFLLTSPFFSIQAVTVRIRVLLAVLLTWMVYPLTNWPVIDPFTAIGLREIFMQVFVGVLLGTLLQVVNSALIVGGQAISASMGLSMANMVDPNMGNVPVIAQFLVICSTLVFLGLGGHVLVISLLLESFKLLPIGEIIEAKPLLLLTIEWSAMILLGGLLLALPIMTSLLLINIGLGVITRAAPALNIFAVGFPAMILAGMILLAMSMSSIGFRIQWLWQEAFEKLGQVLGVV